MSTETATSQLQRDFHRRADPGRFRNRLDNPFIVPKERALAERIAVHLPEHGRLLEVGCGEGNGLYFLRELRPGARLTGLDFSPQKIAFLSSVLPEVEARLGDAAELPFAAGLFDLVLCRDLLHHLPHARERVVSEALRVAKPGGTVVVVESDGRRLLNRLFSLLIPAERGLLASRPELLLALAKPHGEAELQYVEASFMIRALAFFLGWPKKPLSLPVSLLYRAAGLWEALVEKSVPKSRWSYMMLVLSKGR